ncbi:8377_t:CDS:2, partial [Entrophospora sp. SA101]
MRIKYKIDQQEFIVRVVKGTSDDEWMPGYVCESDIKGRIYSTPTAVVNEFYKKDSDTKTLFFGPDVLASIGSSYQEELNFAGSTPTDVWNKLMFLRKYDGKELFGLTNSFTILKIKNYIDVPCCTFSEWDYINNMMPALEKHLKRKISVLDLNWHQFFIGWKEQLTT